MSASPATGLHGREADYAALRRTVAAAGLLEPAYAYYAVRGGTCLGLLVAACAVALLLAPAAAGVIVGGPLLAFAVVQVALIGHDAGHQSVFRRPMANWALGIACWSLVAGVGFWYWNDRHNRHHGHTNDPDEDPDLRGDGLLAVAYTEQDGASRSGWRRLVVRHQTLLIPLVVALLALAFRIAGALFAWRRLRGPRRAVELGALALNAGIWLVAFRSLGWWGAALFLVSQAVAGVYLAAIIAPNHKGMPVWAREADLSFLERQVLSSRNVAPHPVWDFVFGGLNYQIEHHLFPTMPRVRLRAARAIVRPFCEARGLEYTEVGPLTSYRMVYRALSSLRRSAR